MDYRPANKVASFFIGEEKFLEFLETKEFENFLREASMLDSWRAVMKATGIKYNSRGFFVSIEDIFNEFLRAVYESDGNKGLASISTFFASRFLLYDSKRGEKLITKLYEFIIPYLGVKLAVVGKAADFVDIDEPIKKEVLANDKFESLLLGLGQEFLEARQKAWSFLDNRDSKSAIDWHRRLVQNVLEKLAPDEEIIKSSFYNKAEHKEKPEPFWAERIRFLMGKLGDKETETIDLMAKAITRTYGLYSSDIHMLKDVVKEHELLFLMSERLLHLLLVKKKES